MQRGKKPQYNHNTFREKVQVLEKSREKSRQQGQKRQKSDKIDVWGLDNAALLLYDMVQYGLVRRRLRTGGRRASEK